MRPKFRFGGLESDKKVANFRHLKGTEAASLCTPLVTKRIETVFTFAKAPTF